MNKATNIIYTRFIIALAICPLVTALLIVVPTYFGNDNNFIMQFYMIMVVILIYAGSLIIGLPIALYLFTKNKCSFTALAISGFTIGFLALIITKQGLNQISSQAQLILTIKFAVWYGASAAIGAALFGYITGVSTWYNKSLKAGPGKNRRAP